MKVTLRFESLDGRVTPSGAHGGGGVEWITGAMVPSGHGGEVAHVSTHEAGQQGGVEIFGTGYKPGTTSGQG